MAAIGLLTVASIVLTACDGSSATATPAAANGAVKTREVQATSFKFTPRDVAFNVGDTVDFTLSAADIQHTYTAKDLGLDIDVSPGKPVTKRVVLAKAGTFKVVCTVAGHEGAGMIGSIKVS